MTQIRHFSICEMDPDARDSTRYRIRCSFALSVSLILLFAGFVKIVAIFRKLPILLEPDPVFTFLQIRHTLGIAAFLEVVVGGYVIFNRNRLSAMVASSWLVAIFACYRILREIFYAAEPCVCFVRVLEWTNLPKSITNSIPVVLLWYIGSVSFLFLASSSFGGLLKKRQQQAYNQP